MTCDGSNNPDAPGGKKGCYFPWYCSLGPLGWGLCKAINKCSVDNIWCYMGFIGRTHCANQGTINQDGITKSFNAVGDAGDCKGSFLWCWVLQPIIDVVWGALQTLCDWVSCTLTAKDSSIGDKILGYMLRPVCWLMQFPDLCTGIVIVGAGLFFLAPLLDLYLITKV